ncbi:MULTISPECIES: ribose-phosphate diphosphokinase [unclassified Acinetobacter]|uniref:ribose-phosphate diphosphokinase n=1 Tax=unclassified Acinetobacter TaxID=196816 RepID=UPI00244BD296|nr:MULTISPECIES: ribose-phosphate diphosphokinase [unclassified Acinetobacter]MDH0030873.1 ribose-phosphate diphosphokinase [Acinetobacter sp. GD04021]MDH0886354.1 ribose-phosphate diphosphokinase [Acinetobacter sp. GD03873]MDH1082896.1 ribose-phosphate diphosphokinase [Acinetobacter sp. GD03983]MDH2189922.1 ribose-phosphate diphosphokinase [Acinetobacter sp. GD03645]MDH2203075.1 ribose-phosphate diphosphokinase [Acinetobacter sp. GD03647]
MAIQLKTSNVNVPIEFLQFSGGERHIQLNPSLLNPSENSVQIKASISNSTDVMDYLLLENVLLQQGIQLAVEIPYFPYARQDRICAQGQAFSLNLMTKLLNSNTEQYVGQRQEIVVWDCHSQATLELLRANTTFQNVVNIEPIQIIRQSEALMQILLAENTVLVCPDAGATQRTQAIANGINAQRQQAINIIHCEKVRDANTGKIRATQVHSADLTGKTVVITDDICDGGATFIGIAQQLRRLHCQNIILYVTHGIFSKGLNVFDGLVDQIFTSNSRPQQAHSKLNIIHFEN